MLAEQALAEGRTREAVDWARRRCAVARWDESAHRALVRAMLADGDRAGAADAAQRFTERLRADLGVAPSPTTRSLHADVASGAAPRAAVSIFGRAAELGLLDAAWRATTRGSGRVVVVTGEPGIGKTTLLDELGRRASARGARTARAAGLDVGGAMPFGVWLELARGLAAQVPPPAPAALWPLELTRLSEDLGAALGRSGVAPPVATPELERLRVFEASLRLVEWAAADRPVLLVVDDAHQADRASMRLLAHLARRLGGLPVAIALACPDRPTAEMDVVADVAARSGVGVARVAVGPITPEAVAALAASLGLAGEGEVDRVVAAAEGNALLATESARALAAGDSGPPPNLRAAVRVSAGRLSPAARRLLDLVAAAERPLTGSELVRLGDVAADENGRGGARRRPRHADRRTPRLPARPAPGGRLRRRVRPGAPPRRPGRGRRPGPERRGRRALGTRGPTGPGHDRLGGGRHLRAFGRGVGRGGRRTRSGRRQRPGSRGPVAGARGAVRPARPSRGRGADLGRRPDPAAGRVPGGGLVPARRPVSERELRSRPLVDRIPGGPAGLPPARLAGRTPAGCASGSTSAWRGTRPSPATPVRHWRRWPSSAARWPWTRTARTASTSSTSVCRASSGRAGSPTRRSWPAPPSPLLDRDDSAGKGWRITVNAAAALVCEGDDDGALRFVERAVEDAREAPAILARSLGALAHLQARTGRPAEARATLAEQGRVVERLAAPEFAVQAAADAGLVALALGDPVEAADRLGASLDGGLDAWRPSTALARAEALALAGDHEAATVQLRAALEEPTTAADQPWSLLPRVCFVQALVAVARDDTRKRSAGSTRPGRPGTGCCRGWAR